MLKKGLYIVQSGKVNDDTVFVPLEGGGPFLLSIKMPSLEVLNITIGNSTRGWAIDVQAPNKFSFFRQEARLFYSMNKEKEVRDLLDKDDLFQKSYSEKKDMLVVSDDASRESLAEYAIKKIETAMPKCNEVLSRSQIVEMEKDLNVLDKEKKNNKVKSRDNPYSVSDNLDGSRRMFGGLNEDYVAKATDAFSLDANIVQVSNLIKTAKAKRHFIFNETYPEDEMGNSMLSGLPICSTSDAKKTVQKCIDSINNMRISTEKKADYTTRLYKLISNADSTNKNSSEHISPKRINK